MGCDYYTYCCLKINHKDDKEPDIIQISKKGGYLYVTYDSDSEDDYDRQFDKEIESLMFQAKNKNKILFENDEQTLWKISSPFKIKYYKKLIGNSVDFDKILSIEKIYYIEER